MTELALKHKDSLVLKEDRLHDEQRPVRKYVFKKKKTWKELSFPWLTSIVFVFYWFFLVPLCWLIGHLIKRWSWLYWHFWTVAVVVWIAIICGIIVLWKRLEVKRNHETTLKYGSDHKEGSYSNVRGMTSENEELVEMKKMNNARDEESKKNDRNPSPLTIHKRICGEDEDEDEDDGVEQVEEDETTQGSDIADDCKDHPFQDNLKLVTVSFSEDEVKTPMSPRELFFIDLIREAEKTESAKSPKTHFFSSEMTEDDAKDVKDVKEDAQDATDVKDAEDAENAEDAKSAKDENDGETSELKSKRQSNYFVWRKFGANVESSADEKTEVFLQINSSEQTEAGKPVLTLKSNEENSQEISPSQAR